MSPYGFVQNICWVEGVPASLASCFSVESLSGKSSGFFRPSLRPLWADGEKDLEGGGWGVGAAIVSLAASTGMGLPRGNDRYPVPAFPPSSVIHEIMRQVRVVAGLQMASLSLQESAPLGGTERLFQARTWLKAPQKTSGKASPPGLLLWDPAQPPRPGAAAADASGHTHRLLVPARLAGVLEASKLAIPGGPAVLVNDALLGRGRGWLHQQKAEQQTRSVPFYPSTPPRPRQAQGSPDSPSLHGHVDSCSSVSTPSRPGGALAHTGRLGLCPPGRRPSSHNGICVQPPPHIPRAGSTETRGHLQAEQMDLIKELMSSSPRRLHRRGWSPGC